jgi:hypothetical protein
MINGFTVTQPSDYDVIPAIEAAVDALGGVRLLE